MERTRQDLVLGIVFFASLGILMWATVQLTGLSFLGEPQQRTAYFEDGFALEEGDIVYVAGRRMGSVASIRYNHAAKTREERIVVVMLLDEPIELTDAYSLEIEPGGLLGGVQVGLDPGTGPRIVPDGEILRGTVKVGGLEAVGDLFSDEALGEDLRAILRGIREAVDRLNAGESTIGKLFADPALYDEAAAAVRSARATLEAIERGESVFGRLASDATLGESAAEFVNNLTTLTRTLNGTDGLVPRLINDTEMGTEGRQIVGDFAVVTADLRAGRGAIGAALSDPEMEDDLRRITGGFADFADKVTDPEAGVLGELVAGGAMRERLSSFVSDLADMSAEVREARGLLGRLIYDEEMGEQFTRMLSQVSRAIEDAREAAPVGTFFQVLTGAF